MNTLSDNPWNVSVSWHKSFGQKSRLVVKINTFLRVPAGVYACNFISRQFSLYWTNVNNLLVLGSESRVVTLNAIDEVKSSVRVSNIVVWAVLNLVEHTLINTMLAGEGPWITISIFVGIAVGDNKNICHVKEVGVSKRLCKWPSYSVLAVWAQWLDVYLNLHFLGDSQGSRQNKSR